MKLTFMRVIVIVVVIAIIVVNAPGQELPYLHSLSLHSPLCTLPSPTGIERAYQLLGQTIT